MNGAAPVRWRVAPILLAWVVLLILETTGQVALKKAGLSIGVFEPNVDSLLAALSTPWLWLGIVCYLGEFVAWMSILEKSALSTAFPTSAIVFVSVMIASWAVFGDPMGWEKILGSAIIVAGILLLGGEHEPHSSPGNGDDAEGRAQ